MINLLCNKLFILAPIYFKQTTGFSALIITTLVFAIILIYWNIYCKFCKDSINKLLTSVTLRNVFVFTIALLSMTITAVTIKQYSIEIKESIFDTTPLWLIILTFLIALLCSLIYKLNSIGTVSTIFVPAIFFVALVLVIISVSKNDLYNFFPVIDTNFNSFLKKVILMLSMNYELIYLFFLPDILQKKSKLTKIGNRVILRSYFYFLAVSVIFSITTPEFMNKNYEPFFDIIKQAHLGPIAVKLDSLFLILYCISAYIYISSMLLLSLKIISKSSKRAFSLIIKPLPFIIICLTTLVPGISDYIFKFLSDYYFILCLVTFVAPPIILISNKVLICK